MFLVPGIRTAWLAISRLPTLAKAAMASRSTKAWWQGRWGSERTALGSRRPLQQEVSARRAAAQVREWSLAHSASGFVPARRAALAAEQINGVELAVATSVACLRSDRENSSVKSQGSQVSRGCLL